MSFWVYIPTDGKPWHVAEEFRPPIPGPVAGRGYAYYLVEIDGFTFEFASLAELYALKDMFSKKLLPSSLRLSIQRGAGYGPNNHWLNRLPRETTSWRYRQKAMKYLLVALKSFETQTCPRTTN